MAMRTLKNSRLFLISSAAILLSPSAFANNSAPEVVSSLCQPEVTQRLDCAASRECVFKTQSAIKDFFDKYEAPAFRPSTDIKFPKNCTSTNLRYSRHAVNLTYAVGPDGKPQQVQVVNSSGHCFSKAAKAYYEKIEFKPSDQGYSCVPATVSFISGPLDDITGLRVDNGLSQGFDFAAASSQVFATNTLNGR